MISLWFHTTTIWGIFGFRQYGTTIGIIFTCRHVTIGIEELNYLLGRQIIREDVLSVLVLTRTWPLPSWTDSRPFIWTHPVSIIDMYMASLHFYFQKCWGVWEFLPCPFAQRFDSFHVGASYIQLGYHHLHSSEGTNLFRSTCILFIALWAFGTRLLHSRIQH